MAALVVASNLDILGNEIQNFKIHNLATAPVTTGWSGINLGRGYYNTTDFTFYIWNGSTFVSAGVSVATNLALGTATTTTQPITNTNGTGFILPAATVSLAGLLSSADKTKLDTIASGAQVNVATNIGSTHNASTVSLSSSTGTGTTLNAATGALAGVLTAADKTKLDTIASGAQVNVPADLTIANRGVTTLDINSSSGTDITVPAATTLLTGLLTAADKTKLDGLITNTQSNLSLGTVTSIAAPISNSDGTGVSLPLANATGPLAGLLSGADKQKLDGIQAGAQVSAATNLTYTSSTAVVANSNGTGFTITDAVAGGNKGLLTGADKTRIDNAVVTTQTDVTATWLLTAVDLSAGASSNTKVASQLAVKTYVDNLVLTNGSLVYKSGYDAAANNPLLDVTPIAGIRRGWTYVVTVSGAFFTINVEPGDMIIALQDTPTLEAHWTVVNKNIPDVLATVLTGYTIGTNTVLTASDSLLLSLRNLQGQISAGVTATTAKAGKLVANIGDGAALTYAITHALGADVIVQARYVANNSVVLVEIVLTNATTVTLNFNAAPTLNSIRVTIIG